MSTTAFIGLGSNLDNPAQQLQHAFGELAGIPETVLLGRSKLYASTPMGPADQPDYINAVAALRTALVPDSLLQALQAIEARHGRERPGRRWGPRTLDLDLLLYGQEVIERPGLTVPHRGLHERDFVIIPLLEIAGDIDVPGHGPLSALGAQCRRHALEILESA